MKLAANSKNVTLDNPTVPGVVPRYTTYSLNVLAFIRHIHIYLCTHTFESTEASIPTSNRVTTGMPENHAKLRWIRS